MKLLKYEPSDLRRAWTTKGTPSALEEDLQECDETVNQDPERQRPPGFTAAPPALVFFSRLHLRVTTCEEGISSIRTRKTVHFCASKRQTIP